MCAHVCAVLSQNSVWEGLWPVLNIGHFPATQKEKMMINCDVWCFIIFLICISVASSNLI